MTTRSFTIYAGDAQPGVVTTLWEQTPDATVLVKTVALYGWTGGSGLVQLYVVGPAGPATVWSATVGDGQSYVSSAWLALSPSVGLSLWVPGPGLAKVHVFGTLLPPGPGLARVTTLPGPGPSPTPHHG